MRLSSERIKVAGEVGKLRGLETAERLQSHILKGRMTKEDALSVLKLEKQYIMEKVCESSTAAEQATLGGELEGIKKGIENIEETVPVLVEGMLFTDLEDGASLLSSCKVNLRTRQVQGIARSAGTPEIEAIIIDNQEFLVVNSKTRANIMQEEREEHVFWY